MTHAAARSAALLALLGALAAGCTPPSATWGPGSLSFFEPAPEGLAWVRLEPGAKGTEEVKQRRAVITTLPNSAGTPHVAWRADGARALVWFEAHYDNAAGAERPAHIWEVELASGAKVEVPPPALGRLDSLGYAPDGRAIALVQPEWKPGDVPLKDAKGQYFLFEGRRYDLHPDMREGLPQLVHALALSPERTWQRIETVVTDTGWDYATGVRRLAAAATLGARTPALLTSHPDTEDLKAPTAIAALVRLAPRTKAFPEGNWATLVPSKQRVAVWLEQAGEFMHATDLIAFTGEPPALVPFLVIPSPESKALMPGPNTTGVRGVSPQVQGDRLLVADAHDGEHPRVFDLTTRTLLFSSDVARTAVFWPEPGTPATASPK